MALAYAAYLRLTPTGSGAPPASALLPRGGGGGEKGGEGGEGLQARLRSLCSPLASALATTGSPFRLAPDAAAELGCAVADCVVGGTALALALGGVRGAGGPLPSPGTAATALLLGAQCAGLALYLATRGSLAAAALRAAPWPAGPPAWLARGAVLASTGARPSGPPPGPGVPLPDQRFANAVSLAARAVVATDRAWLARKYGARWAAAAGVGSGSAGGRPLPALVVCLGPAGGGGGRRGGTGASEASSVGTYPAAAGNSSSSQLALPGRGGSGATAAASAAGPGPLAFSSAGPLVRGGSAASSAGGGPAAKPGAASSSNPLRRTASGAPSSLGGDGGDSGRGGSSLADRARAWVGGGAWWGRGRGGTGGTTSASEPEPEAPASLPPAP